MNARMWGIIAVRMALEMGSRGAEYKRGFTGPGYTTGLSRTHKRNRRAQIKANR